MSACYRASLPTTHPALTPLGFSNLLNFPPCYGRVRRAPSTKWHGGASRRIQGSLRGTLRRSSEHLPEARAGIPCGTGSDPRPERQFRVGLWPILGQSGDSVWDCRRSQARTAILCGTVADPRAQLRFCVGLSTIPGRNGYSVWEWRRSQARTAILCESGVFLNRGAPNPQDWIFAGLDGKFRVI